MKELIRHILKEQNEGLKERFIKSANKMVYIIETHVESNLITNIEIENIMFDEKYSEISGDLIITSWCEDPDILEFIRTLKMVDKEIEKVLLNYTFRSNGSFGEKGEWNNLMWYMIACNWDIDNNDEIKMKYHFRQEEYDDE
jgi:hypothetical protein